MKKIFFTFSILFLLTIFIPDSFAKYQFGNILLEKHRNEMKKEKVGLVVFPHWIHTLWFKCKVCHNDPFIPESGANDITMKEINDGKKCGLCHNDNIAFSQKECERCHSLSSDDSDITLKVDKMTKRLYPGIFTTKIGKEKDKKNKHLKFADPNDVPFSEYKAIADKLNIQWDAKSFEENGLPRNRLKTIDYAKLILEDKTIIPKGSITGEGNEEKRRENFIVFEVLSDFVDNIAFPHSQHTYLLNCDTCHEKVFKSELGGNDVHMRQVSAGKFCGYCHNNVSFPLALCVNCHTLPKGEKVKVSSSWPGEILVRKNPLKGKKIDIKRGSGFKITGEKSAEELEEEKKSTKKAIKKIKAGKKKQSLLSLIQASEKDTKKTTRSTTAATRTVISSPPEKKNPAPPKKTEPVVKPEPKKTVARVESKKTVEKPKIIEQAPPPQKVKTGGCLFLSW